MGESATGPAGLPTSVEDLQARLRDEAYLADRGLATALFIALSLQRPILLEGAAGVGKTEVAKVLAGTLGARLIRLQCYEGIDASQALYEWDYARQLLYIRSLDERQGARDAAVFDEVFSERFLRERPLLEALRSPDPVVLLIDEVDRADEEFEAFLLEILSDFQVSIPEIGTIQAQRTPPVVLTSNRTRELHDALKRRCVYHWLAYPDSERELEILRARAPEVPNDLSRQVVEAVARIRELPLAKAPGVAESIDWAYAVRLLGLEVLSPDTVTDTLGALLKDEEDLARVRTSLAAVFGDG
jgi:MoxR-like ATPase